jgi:hypothetical protein
MQCAYSFHYDHMHGGRLWRWQIFGVKLLQDITFCLVVVVMFDLDYYKLPSSVSISVWRQTGRPGFDIRRRQRIFPGASVSRLALEDRPGFFPIGAGVLSQEQSAAEGVTLTTHPHLVPRSRMSMGYTSSPARRMYGGSGTTFKLKSADTSACYVEEGKQVGL